MANPYIEDIGSVTLPADATSVVVTHAYTMDDTAYYIGVQFPYQTSWWITSISTTQFTINVGSTNGYAQTLIWKIEGRGAKT